MNEKSFFESKTSWGAMLLLAAPVLQHYGITFDAGVVQTAIMDGIGVITVLIGQFGRNSKITSILPKAK